ncbi:hypothetical protein KZZ52_48975 [Dactylosporangium sp. AC04546]|uniref:hypothetical protein n=1 Tax=Dactylosporangium sp. AC04546 TaxID=2862460 RepID=UPI002E7AB71F|nr:hypothetical protein [Dactylosporangium sp. AC04546]WVK81822.1 hypothetical protein KZZ52_48975 [Dactylosporangium sp. AC04546]
MSLENLRTELHGLADEVRPTDLHDRTLGTSRRLRLRRTAVTSVAALAALVAASGLALAVAPEERTVDPPAASSTPPPPASGAPSTAASSAPPPAVLELPRYQGTAPPRFAAGPLANARADIGWSSASQCGTGLVKFAGGTSAYPGRPGTMHVVRTAAGDVNRDGTADLVAVLECEAGQATAYQVVALTADGTYGGEPVYNVIGQAALHSSTRADGFRVAFDAAVAADGAVRVQVGDRLGADWAESATVSQLQWRTYRVDGGVLRQTGGPTTFPADPPTARYTVDATNLVFDAPQDGRRTGRMTVEVRNEGTAAIPRTVLGLKLPSFARPAGDPAAWAGCGWEGTADTVVLCDLAELTPGGSRRLTLTFLMDDAARNGTTDVGLGAFARQPYGTDRVLERGGTTTDGYAVEFD